MSNNPDPQDALCEAILLDDIDAIQVAVDHGANISTVPCSHVDPEKPPLALAISNGHTASALKLLDLGADISLTTPSDPEEPAQRYEVREPPGWKNILVSAFHKFIIHFSTQAAIRYAILSLSPMSLRKVMLGVSTVIHLGDNVIFAAVLLIEPAPQIRRALLVKTLTNLPTEVTLWLIPTPTNYLLSDILRCMVWRSSVKNLSNTLLGISPTTMLRNCAIIILVTAVGTILSALGIILAIQFAFTEPGSWSPSPQESSAPEQGGGTLAIKALYAHYEPSESVIIALLERGVFAPEILSDWQPDEGMRDLIPNDGSFISYEDADCVDDSDLTLLWKCCMQHGYIQATNRFLASDMPTVHLHVGVALAAYHGQGLLVQHLLENGASVEGHSTLTLPPLLLAASRLEAAAPEQAKKYAGTIRALLHHGAEVDCALDPSKFVSSNTAAIPAWTQSPLWRDLTNLRTPLGYAALSGCLEAVEALLEHNANPNIADSNGDTPLHHAHGTPILQPIQPILVQRLISAGANVNAQNRLGQTPLHTGCSLFMLPDQVATLIEAGADLGIVDNSGCTALQVACRLYPIDVVQVFLDAGADVNASANNSESSLLRACGRNYIQPDVVSALLEYGADIHTTSADGENALHMVCRNYLTELGDQLACVRLLVASGVDINATQNFRPTSRMVNMSALGLAVTSLSDEISYSLAKCLIEAGADPNGPSKGSLFDEREMPCLLAACSRKRESERGDTRPDKLVDLLLDAGADMGVMDARGRTALHVAVEAKNWAAVISVLRRSTIDYYRYF